MHERLVGARSRHCADAIAACTSQPATRAAVEAEAIEAIEAMGAGSTPSGER